MAVERVLKQALRYSGHASGAHPLADTSGLVSMFRHTASMRPTFFSQQIRVML